MPMRAGAAGGDGGGGDVGGGAGGGGAGAGAGALSESSVIVTGPSLTKCTCMSAPNWPCCTLPGSFFSTAATNLSQNGRERAGGIA